MISRRYAFPLVLALLLAVLPTLRHGYFGYLAPAAPINSASLPAAVAGTFGVSRQGASAWAVAYAADSTAERVYDVAGEGRVSLFVARGFDLKKLYHHPELGVLRGRSFHPLETARLPDTDRPVYVLRNSTESESAVYALVYEDRWVSNPYVLQLSSAVTSLWSGRRPLTLVFAYGAVLRDGAPTPFVSRLLMDTVDGLRATASNQGRP